MLHTTVPVALFALILLIAGVAVMPRHHGATAAVPDITTRVPVPRRVAAVVASLPASPTQVKAPAAMQPAAPAPAPAPVEVSLITPPPAVAAGRARVELEQQDQPGRFSAVSTTVRDAQSISLTSLPVEAGAPATRETIAGWLALPALATIASLSIAGAGQASAMIDGKVSVQPAAAAAGEIQKGAQL